MIFVILAKLPAATMPVFVTCISGKSGDYKGYTKVVI